MTDEEKRALQRAQCRTHELAADLVPGTAGHNGHHAIGGQEWVGRARMADARRHAGIPLDNVDRDALNRHPPP